MVIVIVFIVILSLLVYFLQRNYGYWKKKNVVHPKPIPFFGNYADFILLRKNFGETVQSICRKFPDEPIIGAYYGTKPVLIINSPDMVKLITTKDFYYFNGREVSDHTHKEVLTRNLFFTNGDNWKVLRQNFSPLFSPTKMKNMFPMIENCCKVFKKLLEEETSMSNEVEVRQLMTRFTMDCVCTCSFGIDPKCMTTNSANNPFQKISDVIFDVSRTRATLTLFRAVWPGLFYGLGLNLFPIEIYNFFKEILLSVFKERENSPPVRQDFVDLVMTLRDNDFISGDSIEPGKGKISVKVDKELLVAQCVVFFAAGFETSASTSSFTLFELAKHPDVQQRVLEEIDAYFEKKDTVNYDCITDLPYLDQCVDEALRLNPVLSVLTRDVHRNYTLPNGVTLERGMRIHLPIFHIQRDPKYFPDPDQFKPERFDPENKKNIVPYSYFPFGEGPRICIGMRFAKMQMLAGLATLLRHYRVELAEGMPRNVAYQTTAMVTQLKTGIYLKLIRRPTTNTQR